MKRSGLFSKNRLTLIVALLLSTGALAQSATSHHTFPKLPYEYDALEPYIDAQTMNLHYDKHHRGYYNKFINAIDGTPLATKSMKELFAQANSLSLFVRNNAGGYYNHTLYWENMTPDSNEIPDQLKKALTESFGSVEAFKSDFAKAAASVFGSGWAWLVKLPGGGLSITTTANQDNPLMDDVKVQGQPLLALDVWEHAYYLHYQNRRTDYIDSFWHVVNWKVVYKRYSED